MDDEDTKEFAGRSEGPGFELKKKKMRTYKTRHASVRNNQPKDENIDTALRVTGNEKQDVGKQKQRFAFAQKNIKRKKSKTKYSEDGKGKEKIKLRLVWVSPLYAGQVTFLISAVVAAAGIVAMTFFWFIIDAAGFIDRLKGFVTDLFGSTASGINIVEYLSLPRLLAMALLWAMFQIVVITGFVMSITAIYNVIVRRIGGIYCLFEQGEGK